MMLKDGEKFAVAYYVVGQRTEKSDEEIVSGPYDTMTTVVDAMAEVEAKHGDLQTWHKYRVVKGLLLDSSVGSDSQTLSQAKGKLRPKQENSKVVKLHGDS